MTTNVIRILIISNLFFLSSVQAINLKEKLNKQWQHYENAKRLLLSINANQSLPIEKRVLSREAWENAIKLDPEFRFTRQNIRKLIKTQNERINKAREQAIKVSKINLQTMRELPSKLFQKEVKNFCSKIPKGGMLHIHPFGTFNRETVNNLLLKYNPTIPTEQFITNLSNQNSSVYLYPDEILWLKKLPINPSVLSLSQDQYNYFLDLLFLPEGNHSFERFDAVFWTLGVPVSTFEQYREALLDFGQRAFEQKVSYIEFTAGVSLANLPFYLSIVDEYKKKFNIVLRINHSFYRLEKPEKLMVQAQNLVKEINSPIVVGIDLLGNETFTPAFENGQSVYATVQNMVNSGQSNFRRTMHAGELGDVRNPRDAMIMGAERLGHGIALNRDPVAIEYAIFKNIAIEINLTSNIRLQAIDNIKNHPFLRYLRLGLPVSLSTDDEGIFETDINTECILAIKNSDVTYFELKQMALNSIKTSFASEEIKANLLIRVKEQFLKFENEYL